MIRNLLPVLIVLISTFLVAQEPAYKEYTSDNGMPDFYYFYLSYTNDTLFISTDEVNLYCYNGIDFTEVKHPPSKYIYREIKFLKRGYFMRNTMNHYWYRRTDGDWKTIPTPGSNIVLNDTLLGFNSDSIVFFNEDSMRWDFFMKIKNDTISVKTHYPNFYLTPNNEKLLVYRKKNKSKSEYKVGEWFYDIVADTFIYVPVNSLQSQGSLLHNIFYLNQTTGDIKWGYLKNDTLNMSNFHRSIEPGINDKMLVKRKFEDNNKSSYSNIFEQENKLHFFTFDTISSINYKGTFNIPRANYQKVKEDMYFVGSFEGLYKVNPFITYYSPFNSGIDKNIRSIVKHRGTVWAASYGSGLYELSNNDFVSISPSFQKGKYKNILNGGFALNDNEAYFFNEGYNTMYILQNNTLKAYEIYSNGIKSWDKGYFIDTLNDGRLAFSLQYDNFGILDSIVENRVYITSIADKYGLKHGSSWVFDQDIKGRVWLGRFTAGLAVYDMKSDTVIQFKYDLDKEKSFGVISLYIDKYDRLWLGTNKGLYVLNNISKFDIYTNDIFDKAKHIELPNGDNSLVAAIKNVDNYIVFGNNTGINFLKNNISFPNDTLPIYQFIYGEDINGTGTELNCLFYDKKRYLWVSTKSGLLKIDIKAIKFDTTRVNIRFDYIKNADNLLTIIDNKIEINAVKRNIDIKFSPKENPSFLNNIYYDYILTNSSNDTILNQCRSKNNELQIDYLNPDNYSLKVNAYKNGILQDTAFLDIAVPYTFGENPLMWFLIPIILLALLATFFYFRKEKIKELAQKELELAKIENEKTQLKVKAIISTFNPHFINNSLHWVQSRYYKDKETARLIGRLSENIDYIFKKTKTGLAVHTVKQELKLVENYIAIQQIRFGNSFRYIAPDSAMVDKYGETNLIVLQIQIHVENAIEHGLRNRPQSSYVKVEITEDKQFVIITITDDGIGRTAAKKIISRGSQTGVKMLNELHAVYNRLEKNKYKLESKYEDDIFSDGDTKYGTRVIIKIPKGIIFQI